MRNNSIAKYLHQINNLEQENKRILREIQSLRSKIRDERKEASLEKKSKPRIPKVDGVLCPECKKGQLKILDIPGRNIRICSICDYRKCTLKKLT